MTIEQIAADEAHYARMAVMTAEAAARRAARIATRSRQRLSPPEQITSASKKPGNSPHE